MYVAPAPRVEELLPKLESARLGDVLSRGRSSSLSEYLHWDKLRHLEPPADLTHEEWWLTLKLARAPLLRPLPLRDAEGMPFVFGMPDTLLQLLHFVDQRCSGEIAMPEVVTADDQARQHYLVNSLMEEAIRSSQLEGAATSRRVAKELLQSGREPVSRGERMILNNYRALQFMRDSLGTELTPAHVLEMQRILTEGTLENPDAAGRLQGASDDRVAVFDRVDGELVHRPPPAEQLPERLEQLCAFANERDASPYFLHPVVRSVLLHFWLAYDHPFEDGNGRTARLLFYWSMRRHGYWLTEYLSISRILRQGPAKYMRSFLLTETDERDATYFLLFQLEVVKRAVEELDTYFRRKVAEIRKVERALRGAESFNRRQLTLLSDAARNPDHHYTYATHARIHRVTHETARTDLTQLWQHELLVRRRVGRRHTYAVPADLAERLASL
ncbi:MAG TPA: Fic family protein [Gaiellaceae bacterium]|nr:Fic family protein [Gaiellaceae bacterium]